MNELALDRAPAAPATLLVRGAVLFDPAAGLDRVADLLVRDGEVAEVGDALEAPPDAEVVDAEGLHALPAFVDPHVHLRTPGREDEEDVDSGSRAAAAGGYCAILAMPNTDPVVDSASVLRSLRDRARTQARIPTGFLASITRGQLGEELTEMAELSEAGAAGFSDDGLPVRSAGVLRQALQYQRLAGRTLALHEEDPSLSGPGVMHEGEVSALLGLAGIPSVSESTMVARDCELAAYEDGRIHIQHVSARETVVALERAREAGISVTSEATPHHLLLNHEAVRTLDTNAKMNPPLREEADRLALIEALRSGTIDLRGHRPRPARPGGEGAAVRAGADGRDRAGDRVRRAPLGPGGARGPRSRHTGRAHDRRRRAIRDRHAHRSLRARRPTSAWWTWPRNGRWARRATRAARPTAPSRAGG